VILHRNNVIMVCLSCRHPASSSLFCCDVVRQFVSAYHSVYVTVLSIMCDCVIAAFESYASWACITARSRHSVLHRQAVCGVVYCVVTWLSDKPCHMYYRIESYYLRREGYVSTLFPCVFASFQDYATTILNRFS